MNKKIIIVTAVVLVFVAAVLLSNSQQFQGMFLQTPAAEASAKPEQALTRGKFIAMVAKTMMSHRDMQQPKRLGKCMPGVKGYKYEVYVNFACAKKWKSIRDSQGSLDVKNPITKKDAAAILAEAFHLSSSRIFGSFKSEETLGNETAKDWLKLAWKNKQI